MIKSLKYVLKENFSNIYRIYSISKYELLSDMRDSKLGLFWNFANPTIQILTYWFVFGFVMSRNSVDGISYLPWMLGGMVVWFFISPCITNGCNAIYSKINVITKMKFPVSILPTTVVMKELFNHFCLMIILVFLFSLYGFFPSLQWFELIYYLLSAIIFCIALSMVTSVLNMLARDTKKLISSCMRLLLYMTPILWEITRLPEWLQGIIKLNPIYYIVNGYRDIFFYHNGIFAYTDIMISFWIITIALLFIGSFLIYKFKFKFIDMI